MMDWILDIGLAYYLGCLIMWLIVQLSRLSVSGAAAYDETITKSDSPFMNFWYLIATSWIGVLMALVYYLSPQTRTNVLHAHQAKAMNMPVAKGPLSMVAVLIDAVLLGLLSTATISGWWKLYELAATTPRVPIHEALMHVLVPAYLAWAYLTNDVKNHLSGN